MLLAPPAEKHDSKNWNIVEIRKIANLKEKSVSQKLRSSSFSTERVRKIRHRVTRCLHTHTHMDRMLDGTILDDGGLQTTYSKRILNGFALHFCHRSASDLFPIFPHSTSNQRVFQTSVPWRNGCFCETYSHPSDCSKLIVCHKSVFDQNSVCHWAGCVEESFPSYVDLDHV